MRKDLSSTLPEAVQDTAFENAGVGHVLGTPAADDTDSQRRLQ